MRIRGQLNSTNGTGYGRATAATINKTKQMIQMADEVFHLQQIK